MELKKILEECQPFINDDRELFLSALKAVPNYEETLETLITGCPDWCSKAAEHGIFFFLDQVPVPKNFSTIPANSVELRLFQQGTHPCIKVIEYCSFLKIK